ncbi:MurR/RpiR family transcriptional regulator [candidate division KSB1 bacterium]|nr:MurR/RpiR family transcriptional regulator [candidate division KSB1 bacterium]
MQEIKNIKNLIDEILPSLPTNQRKVADFFLDNMHLLALLPIKEVAYQADVSQASIVRFAQLLGFRGYKELKQQISTSLRTQLSPTEQFQYAAAEKSKKIDTLKLISKSVVQNIEETVRSLDSKVFSSAIDRIMHAKQIYCLGLELSAQLAQLMTFMLRLYGYNAQTLSANFMHFREQIAFLSPSDLVIAFSFSPYSRETVEAVSHAHVLRIPIIAFTDKKTSPIREHADDCIEIQTDNIMFSNSLGPIAVILNAIVTELNFRDKNRTLFALRNIEDSIRDERYYLYR